MLQVVCTWLSFYVMIEPQCPMAVLSKARFSGVRLGDGDVSQIQIHSFNQLPRYKAQLRFINIQLNVLIFNG